MPYKNRNNKWIGQIRYHNQTKRKTFKTKKEAIDWERNTEKELQSPRNETPSVLLIDWATAYLQFAELKFVKSVWKEKYYLFQRFFKEVNPGHPNEFKNVQVINPLSTYRAPWAKLGRRMTP